MKIINPFTWVELNEKLTLIVGDCYRGIPSMNFDYDVLICSKWMINNYKEIWLLGQNVNSYKNGQNSFVSLLKLVNEFVIVFIISAVKGKCNSIPTCFNSSIYCSYMLNSCCIFCYCRISSFYSFFAHMYGQY